MTIQTPTTEDVEAGPFDWSADMDMTEEEALRELRRLYNYRETDERQFTRWNMLCAILHGKRLSSIDREALLKAERERCAKVAESFEPRTAETPDEFLAACEVTQDIAQAIRSLPPVNGEKK